MKQVNLNLLEKLRACPEGVAAFKEAFPSGKASIDEVVAYAISKNDRTLMEHANWLLCQLLPRKGKLAYAIFAAKRALPVFEARHPDDKRPRLAVKAAEAVLKRDSEANREKAKAAADAAYYAADTAYAAAYAAYAAANAYYYDYYAAANATANAAYYAAADAAKDWKQEMAAILKHGLKLMENKK